MGIGGRDNFLFERGDPAWTPNTQPRFGHPLRFGIARSNYLSMEFASATKTRAHTVESTYGHAAVIVQHFVAS